MIELIEGAEVQVCLLAYDPCRGKLPQGSDALFRAVNRGVSVRVLVTIRWRERRSLRSA